MQAWIPMAILTLFAALALPLPAAAQTSAAPPVQVRPTGMLRPDEAVEVARALDEAEREIGRTIHVDVVVDPTGRRAAIDWVLYTPLEGPVYATETSMPVLAEDVNAPDGIVVLVDPFEGTGSFVEAPGLSAREERYLSGLMTGYFGRGSYASGLVAVAHGIEDRLDPPHPLPLPTPERPYRESGTEQRTSDAPVALFAGGTVVVVLLLGYFLRDERYRAPRGPERGVGFVAARRDAEDLLRDLAPKVVLLAEGEVALIGRLKNFDEGAPDGPGRKGKAEELLRQAVRGDLWESFVAATALVEEDPEGVLPELRRLAAEVEAALARLDEAERALSGPRTKGDPVVEKHPTRRDETDG